LKLLKECVLLSKKNTKPLLLPEKKKLNLSKLLDLWSNLDLELSKTQVLTLVLMTTKTEVMMLVNMLVSEVTLMTEELNGNLKNDQSNSDLDKRTV